MAEKLPIRLDNLKNKTAIITGGASGLGLATATKFAESGAFVTIADVQEEAGQRIASELTDKGLHVTFVKTDVTDWNSSLAAFKHAVNFGPRKTLDVAALFAGITIGSINLVKEVTDADPEPSLDRDPSPPDFRLMNINLLGVYTCSKLALHYFRLKPASESPEVVQNKKSLILVSSLAGYIDHLPTQYCTAKFGVRGLFRSLRIESRKERSDFTVNVLAPAFVKTPMVTTPHPGEGSRQWLIDLIEKFNLWAPIEYVVDAASLCATNDEVNGRSFCIWPHGFIDNMEDPEDGNGSALIEHARKTGYLKFM